MRKLRRAFWVVTNRLLAPFLAYNLHAILLKLPLLVKSSPPPVLFEHPTLTWAAMSSFTFVELAADVFVAPPLSTILGRQHLVSMKGCHYRHGILSIIPPIRLALRDTAMRTRHMPEQRPHLPRLPSRQGRG